MQRNHALDFRFFNSTRVGLYADELAAYCRWAGLVDRADKQALHAALLGAGARLVTRRHWQSGGREGSAPCYMGVLFDFDLPSLEPLFSSDPVFSLYRPFLGDPL